MYIIWGQENISKHYNNKKIDIFSEILNKNILQKPNIEVKKKVTNGKALYIL